ncbi:hypothetical protein SGLAM104S_00804 [Streptomyces glaucescens]
MGEDHAQGVGEQVGRGLVRRDQYHPQVLPDLVVGQSGLVRDEQPGDVLVGVGPAAGGKPAERLHDVGVAGDRGLGALEHVAGRVHDPLVVLLRHAQEVAHHRHRQILGVLVDQIGLAPLAELVDQRLRVAVDGPAQDPVVDRLHGVGHRPAQPPVLVALRVGADGLPGDVRHQRMIGLDPALHERGPDPAVPAEQRGRAHQPQVLRVAEDHPDRHVVMEQDGGHRAVFLAQVLVQGTQVQRPGAVEPRQRAAAEPVRGAAGRRGEGAVVRTGGGDVRRHGGSLSRRLGQAVRRAGRSGRGCAGSASGS